MTWAEHEARMNNKKEYTVLVAKSEGKRPLVRTKQRSEDNIKVERNNMMGGCGLHLSQDINQWRVILNTVTNVWVPYKGGGVCIDEKLVASKD
jgi:hypothetical protein